MTKYFKSSLWFSFVCMILAGITGFFYGGVQMTITYVISCLMLSILEVSVSLDNAVVNSTVLKNMDEVWRKRFLTWGMIIAVFGMRLIFPLLIVSIAGNIGPLTAIDIAFTDPKKYETILTSVHMEIMAFGGTFLMLVFTSHFFEYEKETHWIPYVGNLMSKIGKHSTAKLFIPILVVLLFSQLVDKPSVFMNAAFWGIVVYLIVDGLGDFFEVEDSPTMVAKTGLGGFLYLEVLDASFSFDGVIAAFSITNNFIIIMLGLGIGAMFVRSLTIFLVEKDAPSKLKYLEDGAFFGVGWLVLTMYLSVLHIELGEIVVACGAAVLIALATAHSMYENAKNKD